MDSLINLCCLSIQCTTLELQPRAIDRRDLVLRLFSCDTQHTTYEGKSWTASEGDKFKKCHSLHTDATLETDSGDGDNPSEDNNKVKLQDHATPGLRPFLHSCGDVESSGVEHNMSENNVSSSRSSAPSADQLPSGRFNLDSNRPHKPRVLSLSKLRSISPVTVQLPGNREHQQAPPPPEDDMMIFIKNLVQKEIQANRHIVKAFDAAVVYHKDDYELAMKFKQHLIDLAKFYLDEDLLIELYDNEEHFSASRVNVVQEVAKKCSLVFCYLTQNFNTRELKFFVEEAVSLSDFHDTCSATFIIKAVHTLPINVRNYKTPPGLASTIAIDWYDRDSAFTRDKLISLLKDAIQKRKKIKGEKQRDKDFKQTYDIAVKKGVANHPRLLDVPRLPDVSSRIHTVPDPPISTLHYFCSIPPLPEVPPPSQFTALPVYDDQQYMSQSGTDKEWNPYGNPYIEVPPPPNIFYDPYLYPQPDQHYLPYQHARQPPQQFQSQDVIQWLHNNPNPPDQKGYVSRDGLDSIESSSESQDAKTNQNNTIPHQRIKTSQKSSVENAQTVPFSQCAEDQRACGNERTVSSSSIYADQLSYGDEQGSLFSVSSEDQLSYGYDRNNTSSLTSHIGQLDIHSELSTDDVEIDTNTSTATIRRQPPLYGRRLSSTDHSSDTDDGDDTEDRDIDGLAKIFKNQPDGSVLNIIGSKIVQIGSHNLVAQPQDKDRQPKRKSGSYRTSSKRQIREFSSHQDNDENKHENDEKEHKDHSCLHVSSSVTKPNPGNSHRPSSNMSVSTTSNHANVINPNTQRQKLNEIGEDTGSLQRITSRQNYIGDEFVSVMDEQYNNDFNADDSDCDDNTNGHLLFDSLNNQTIENGQNERETRLPAMDVFPVSVYSTERTSSLRHQVDHESSLKHNEQQRVDKPHRLDGQQRVDAPFGFSKWKQPVQVIGTIFPTVKHAKTVDCNRRSISELD